MAGGVCGGAAGGGDQSGRPHGDDGGTELQTKGLIGQLKFEGYSTADAKWAVNHVHANWYRQAVRKAKDYLDSQSFSRHGLYEQLLFEKFTRAQVRYGVKKAY